jgi:hypothetical protein
MWYIALNKSTKRYSYTTGRQRKPPLPQVDEKTGKGKGKLFALP